SRRQPGPKGSQERVGRGADYGSLGGQGGGLLCDRGLDGRLAQHGTPCLYEPDSAVAKRSLGEQHHNWRQFKAWCCALEGFDCRIETSLVDQLLQRLSIDTPGGRLGRCRCRDGCVEKSGQSGPRTRVVVPARVAEAPCDLIDGIADRD